MASAALDLAPMSIGDLLDRTVRLYRGYFLHLLSIMAVLAPLLGALSAWRPSFYEAIGNWESQQGFSSIALSAIRYVAESWLYSLGEGAIAWSIAMRLGGKVPTIWGSYRPALRRCGTLAWIAVLTSLVWAAAIDLPVEIGVMLATGDLGPWDIRVWYLVGLGIALFVPGAIVTFFLALAVPAVVIEALGPAAALHRSLRLMRRNGWRAVVVVVFGVAVSSVAFLILVLPFMIVAIWVPQVESNTVMEVLTPFSPLISVPLMAIAYTLLYFDSRIRKEAFDLEMMVGAIGDFGPTAVGPREAAAGGKV